MPSGLNDGLDEIRLIMTTNNCSYTHKSNHSVARQCLLCCKIDQPIYGDSKISRGKGGQNSKITEPIDKKIGVGDYVGDDSPHAKIADGRHLQKG